MTGQKAAYGRLTRRRFISIAAAAGGIAAASGRGEAGALQSFSWRGIALGAETKLIIEHHDAAEARDAIAAALAEVARLEAVFSLHRSDSALARLNRDGRIDDAPADLRGLLAEALSLSARTEGAFDPTIQPVWQLYAGHFADPAAAAEGPPAAAIAAARARTGWRSVIVEGAIISLEKPGMALTLNGIAQGYITDKVGELLKARGFAHVLVDMGEQLALGRRWDGSDWRIGISDPVRPQRLIETLKMGGGALATSGGYGCRFDAAGHFPHLIDPQRGAAAGSWASVSVLAARATTADGLSTALAVSQGPVNELLRAMDARAFVVEHGAESGRWL